MKHEPDCLRDLKLNHFEVSMIKEQSMKIEERDKHITTLTLSLKASQDDVQKTYNVYQKVVAQMQNERVKFKKKEEACKVEPSK